MLEFKDKLKQYRIDNNLTQEQLADILHVSRAAISKYETGRSYPSIEILQDIANLLGVTVDDMISKKELTKETISVSNKIKISKYFSIIFSILIVMGLSISVMAMAKASKNDSENDKINPEIVFCGIVGVASDTHNIEFSEQDFLNQKYFGFAEIYEGNTNYKTVMNCMNSFINFKDDGYELEADIYLSKEVKMISYYFIYFNNITKEYEPKLNSTVSASEGLLRTLDENNYQNKKYSFEFNYIWIDTLLEMKIMEYDIEGNLIVETNYNNEEEYTINENTLYLVIEEKLIDKNEIIYFNREIIFNEEINNTYYYVLKKVNEHHLATNTLIIKKY